MRYHSFLSKDDASWGERQVIKFRWVLIAAILVLIGYIFLSGEVERGIVSLILALVYIVYNTIINVLIRIYDGATWIRYVSSAIDVTVLSAHIFNYSYFFTPIAVSTAPSLFLYAVLIMLSVLRYDGKLVIFTTAYVVLCSNVIYFIRYPDIEPHLFSQVASAGPEGALYRSVYFMLMGYFMFSIPKMINRLVEKQNQVNNERREIEIKLALETQRKKIAMKNLIKEQHLNDQLNHQKQLVQEQKEKLERLVVTKDKLFSIIGHDLRSPFSVQSSISEYLLDDFNSIDKVSMLESLHAIKKTASNGLDMLTNLMDWSKFQNNSFDIKPVEIKVKPLIDRVVDQQSEAWMYKQIIVNQSVDEKISAFADEHMFECVLRNLFSNAIKFTPNKGTVQFKADVRDEKCFVEIIDSGIGMNEEQLKGLFSLDTNNTSLGTNNEQGTGLGLILCKEMIDKNKGCINVKSDIGKGTRFLITLPTAIGYN